MTDDRPLWERTSHFLDRETSIMQRVDKVDTTYAYITVLMALPSTWAMPITQYDTTWAARFIPIDMGATKVPDKYRPPADIKAWTEGPEPDSDLDPARGETPGGVVIE